MNNWIAYVIAHNPSLEIAKLVQEQRIAPLIDESPAVAAKVAKSRMRDPGNTLLTKEFEGGILIFGGRRKYREFNPAE